MKRTKKDIYQDIRRLEAARKKDYAKFSAKYNKAVEHLDVAEERELKKTPKAADAIMAKYSKKRNKVMADWRKSNALIHDKYEPRLKKLYKELGPA